MEGEIKGLEEQIQTNQNEIKNTNLRFQTQIESLNGEMQQSSQQLKKFIEEEEGIVQPTEGEQAEDTGEASGLPKRKEKPLNQT